MTTRIEVDLATGLVTEVPMTEQEISEAQATYAEWLLGEEARKQQQIEQLEQQLAALKGQNVS